MHYRGPQQIISSGALMGVNLSIPAVVLVLSSSIALSGIDSLQVLLQCSHPRLRNVEKNVLYAAPCFEEC